MINNMQVFDRDRSYKLFDVTMPHLNYSNSTTITNLPNEQVQALEWAAYSSTQKQHELERDLGSHFGDFWQQDLEFIDDSLSPQMCFEKLLAARVCAAEFQMEINRLKNDKERLKYELSNNSVNSSNHPIGNSYDSYKYFDETATPNGMRGVLNSIQKSANNFPVNESSAGTHPSETLHLASHTNATQRGELVQLRSHVLSSEAIMRDMQTQIHSLHQLLAHSLAEPHNSTTPKPALRSQNRFSSGTISSQAKRRPAATTSSSSTKESRSQSTSLSYTSSYLGSEQHQRALEEAAARVLPLTAQYFLRRLEILYTDLNACRESEEALYTEVQGLRRLCSEQASAFEMVSTVWDRISDAIPSGRPKPAVTDGVLSLPHSLPQTVAQRLVSQTNSLLAYLRQLHSKQMATVATDTTGLGWEGRVGEAAALEEAEEDVMELRAQIEVLVAEIASNRQSGFSMHQRVLDLESQLDGARSGAEGMQRELRAREAELGDLSDRCQTLLQQQIDAEDENANLQRQHQQIQRQLEMSQKNYTELEVKYDQTAGSLASLQLQYETDEQHWRLKFELKNEAVVELQRQVESLEKSASEARTSTSRIEELDKHNFQLQQETGQLREQLRMMRQKWVSGLRLTSRAPPRRVMSQMRMRAIPEGAQQEAGAMRVRAEAAEAELQRVLGKVSILEGALEAFEGGEGPLAALEASLVEMSQSLTARDHEIELLRGQLRRFHSTSPPYSPATPIPDDLFPSIASMGSLALGASGRPIARGAGRSVTDMGGARAAAGSPVMTALGSSATDSRDFRKNVEESPFQTPPRAVPGRRHGGGPLVSRSQSSVSLLEERHKFLETVQDTIKEVERRIRTPSPSLPELAAGPTARRKDGSDWGDNSTSLEFSTVILREVSELRARNKALEQQLATNSSPLGSRAGEESKEPSEASAARVIAQDRLLEEVREKAGALEQRRLQEISVLQARLQEQQEKIIALESGSRWRTEVADASAQTDPAVASNGSEESEELESLRQRVRQLEQELLRLRLRAKSSKFNILDPSTPRTATVESDVFVSQSSSERVVVEERHQSSASPSSQSSPRNITPFQNSPAPAFPVSLPSTPIPTTTTTGSGHPPPGSEGTVNSDADTVSTTPARATPRASSSQRGSPSAWEVLQRRVVGIRSVSALQSPKTPASQAVTDKEAETAIGRDNDFEVRMMRLDCAAPSLPRSLFPDILASNKYQPLAENTNKDESLVGWRKDLLLMDLSTHQPTRDDSSCHTVAFPYRRGTIVHSSTTCTSVETTSPPSELPSATGRDAHNRRFFSFPGLSSVSETGDTQFLDGSSVDGEGGGCFLSVRASCQLASDLELERSLRDPEHIEDFDEEIEFVNIISAGEEEGRTGEEEGVGADGGLVRVLWRESEVHEGVRSLLASPERCRKPRPISVTHSQESFLEVCRALTDELERLQIDITSHICTDFRSDSAQDTQLYSDSPYTDERAVEALWARELAQEDHQVSVTAIEGVMDCETARVGVSSQRASSPPPPLIDGDESSWVESPGYRHACNCGEKSRLEPQLSPSDISTSLSPPSIDDRTCDLRPYSCLVCASTKSVEPAAASALLLASESSREEMRRVRRQRDQAMDEISALSRRLNTIRSENADLNKYIRMTHKHLQQLQFERLR